MLQMPVEAGGCFLPGPSGFLADNRPVVGVDKAPCVIRRRHRIAAYLRGGGSEYLIEMVVKREKIARDVIFPRPETGHFKRV